MSTRHAEGGARRLQRARRLPEYSDRVRAAVLLALLALAVPTAAGSSTEATGLRGHVTAGGVSAKHRSLWFRRVFVITKTTTDASGNYRILLGAGSYFVSTTGNVA